MQERELDLDGFVKKNFNIGLCSDMYLAIFIHTQYVKKEL